MSPEQQQINLDAEGDLGPHRDRGTFPVVNPFPKEDSQQDEVIAFKFGGSSILGAERMLHAAALVGEAARASRVTVIVSAMKNVTNQLLRIGQYLEHNEPQRARKEAEQVV